MKEHLAEDTYNEENMSSHAESECKIPIDILINANVVPKLVEFCVGKYVKW